GSGEETLVMMAGGGTSSPVMDFKTLSKYLKDDYQVVVIEKAGYGYSEVTDTSRDIDTMLSKTREALKQAGISDPYILFPHSMSGLESLYWSEKYPDEVKAIVGLDIANSAAYEELNAQMPLIYIGYFAARRRIFRWNLHVDQS